MRRGNTLVPFYFYFSMASKITPPRRRKIKYKCQTNAASHNQITDELPHYLQQHLNSEAQVPPCLDKHQFGRQISARCGLIGTPKICERAEYSKMSQNGDLEWLFSRGICQLEGSSVALQGIILYRFNTANI